MSRIFIAAVIIFSGGGRVSILLDKPYRKQCFSSFMKSPIRLHATSTTTGVRRVYVARAPATANSQ